MGRARKVGALLGAATVGSLLQVQPAGADTGGAKQFTFTHTSGQQVTCTFAYGTSDRRDEGGTFSATTHVTSTDPRCAASVNASLVYTDVYGNEQSATANGDQRVYLEVHRVRDGITSIHEAFFSQCVESRSNTCWTGELTRPK